jgi:ATP phosphoribosyltransferase regulatory subunit
MSASTPLSMNSEAHRKVSSPYGFSMYDVEATAALEKASRAAQDILRTHGFERIMPAMVDYPETFAEGTHSEMFSMKDNSGERLALRNDITAQVIKGYVRQIESKAGHEVRKFFYAAPVYKDVRKNYPLPREIYQIGCEVVGANADAFLPELITISEKILHGVFNLKSAVQLGDVRLHHAFAAAGGEAYLAAERRRDVPFLAEFLASRLKVSTADSDKLALWFFYPSPQQNIPRAVKSLPAEIKSVIEATASSVGEVVEKLAGQKIDTFWQPLSEPRSSYYTGIFFETFVPGFTEPMVRGGVYNDLVKRYALMEAGACGFALDLLSF